MTEKGKPTLEILAKSKKRKILNLPNGLILAGALVSGGVIADLVRPTLENGLTFSPSSTLIHEFEQSTVTLGKAGKLDQIPQRFDSQQIKDAYYKYDSETKGTYLDIAALIAGVSVASLGITIKSSRRNR